MSGLHQHSLSDLLRRTAFGGTGRPLSLPGNGIASAELGQHTVCASAASGVAQAPAASAGHVTTAT
jgi:hypothetical protein